MNLHDITGAMGQALKAAEADGVPIEDPNVFRYIDALRAALKTIPPDPVAKRAAKLLACLDDEASNHGDLRITATKRAMGDLRLALNGRRDE
jgi:hypothetical protein